MADVPAPASDADQPIDSTEIGGLAAEDPTGAAAPAAGSADDAISESAAAQPDPMSPAEDAPIAPVAASPEPVEAPAEPLEAAPEPEAAPTEPVFKAAVATPEPIAPEKPEPVEAAPVPSTSLMSGVPTVASTLEVPATATGSGSAEGGEWELLVAKLRAWLASGQLHQQWQAARGPLSVLAGLIAVLLVLRVYGALMGVLDSLPLVPGLLELLGVITVARFSLTRLVRSEERKAVINDLQQRWQAFRGKA